MKESDFKDIYPESDVKSAKTGPKSSSDVMKSNSDLPSTPVISPRQPPKTRKRKPEHIASELGVDPLEILLKFAGGLEESLGLDRGDIDVGMRLTAAKDAASYLYGKKKSIEVTDTSEKKQASTVVVIPSNTREDQSALKESQEAIERHIESGIESVTFDLPTRETYLDGDEED